MLILGVIVCAAIIEATILILEKQQHAGETDHNYRFQMKTLPSSEGNIVLEFEQPTCHTVQTRHIELKSIWAKIIGSLENRSEAFIICLGLGLVLLLGLVDYLTGPDLMFLIFYLAPIFLVSWFVGRRAGVLIAIISTIVLGAADLLTLPSYSHPVVHYWNTAMKLSLFLVINYIISALKAALERLRRVNSDLERRVEERTTELLRANNTLREQIAERRRVEAQFLQIQRMESIGTLASGIAHDLNNVFTPILLTTRILSRRLTDQESEHLLNMITRSAKHGADMVKQILSFARGISSNSVELQLKELLDEISEILKQTIPPSINFETYKTEDLWPVIGDPTQLIQVFMNLCLNARDAMPNGGNLVIRASNLSLSDVEGYMNSDLKPGPFVLISVEDTGDGIPTEIKDKIFEPFFTTKEVGKGTGLGLFTTLGIIKNHCGFLNVYSEVGKGTKFRIYLPAAIEERTTKTQRIQRAEKFFVS